MKRSLVLFIILAVAASSQSTQKRTAFEMADVHASPRPRDQNPLRRAPYVSNGRYVIRSASMLDLISMAFGLDPEKIQGGPGWLEWDPFDVIARVPAGSTVEEQKVMLQNLLVDRFRLVLRTDSRPIPAYALTAAKTARLKPADGSGERGCRIAQQGPGGTTMTGGGVGLGSGGRAVTTTVSCHGVSMEAFTQFLTTSAPQYTNNDPVADETELKGIWDFEYRTSQRGLAPTSESGGNVTLFEALDKQLGLKLTVTKIPFNVTVVESVNEKPHDNLPGVAETLSVKYAPEFAVASVKPTDPAAPFGPAIPSVKPGGAINVAGASLQSLFSFAYGRRTTLEIAPGLQDALRKRYDVIAKPPATGPGTSGSGPAGGPLIGSPDDQDAACLMLRALLADRFKMAVHTEDRPGRAYKLIAVKPKMKTADPSERTKTGLGPGPNEKDPRIANPALTQMRFFQNMTMAQFADALNAPGLVNTPVTDATGLAGSFDFMLAFSPASVLRGGGRGGPAQGDGVDVAQEPDGALTLFEAVERQLGLKLVEEKRPLPVLVIDHVESQPTDN